MAVMACCYRYLLCVRCHPSIDISSLTGSSVTAQIYVVVAAGSVIAFIIRDLGEPAIAGWVIQVLSVARS
jgi:hypothetical protein